MKEIRTRRVSVINEMPIIDEPHLIKVNVIKESYLPQIITKRLRPTDLFCQHGQENIKFIGYCAPWIIYTRDNHLEKMDEDVFLRAMDNTTGHRNKSLERLETLPILFHE